MKTMFQFLLPLLMVASAVADTRPILLVTPKGVYQAEVIDGVPGPWKATDLDVIVQGFSVGGPPVGPIPPGDDSSGDPMDPLVANVAVFSKATLKDKNEGIAVASLIEALQKANVTQESFKESLDMAITIADTSMKAEGRLVKWKEGALKLTQDPAKLKAGLQSAFGISSVSLNQIAASAFDESYTPPTEETQEAKDLAQIIQMIQMILDLLRNLGII